MKTPREVKPHENDSALEYALRHNETDPILYNGVWYPKGWLKKCLDAGKSNKK